MGFTHAIVHFLIDQSVEVVPVEWLRKADNSPDDGDDTILKKCYYPPLQTKNITKQVQKSKSVRDDWQLYECRVFKRYEKYDDARQYIGTAEYTSDLSGAEKSSKRKEVVVPVLPKHPLALDETEVSAGLNADSTLLDSHSLVLSSDQIPLGIETVEYVIATEPEPPRAEVTRKNEGAGLDCEGFQKTCLVKLQNIETMLENHSTLLNNILSALSLPVKKNGSGFNFKAEYFPIKTKCGLNALEELLANNEQARLELKAKLRSYGGGTLEDAVKAIFKFSIVDEVLSEHSLRGQSTKSSFSGYTSLFQTIFAAISSQAKFSGVTMNLYEDALSKNLKRAADRMNARKRAAGIKKDGTKSAPEVE